ncbi:MAG: glutathione S-transferase family protein [Alphaproteobacteria bacterium]|nr:glutathione S-transferase family protein [Alphaproteobacteria bacterium]
MIDVYFWPTPNGYKITIFLEEVGLPYQVIPVDIGAGDQFKPDFLKISPNNRMPAIVDSDGPGGKPMSVFESGAILMYLADKTGKFWSKDPVTKWRTVEWLMFQMASVGPMLGQNGHFRNYAPEKLDYAINRYTNETKRIWGVLDRQLKDREFVVGDYSIADMAIYPWLRFPERHGVDLDSFPNVKRWRAAIDARPAVKKAIVILDEKRRTQPIDDKQRDVLFGATQYARR